MQFTSIDITYRLSYTIGFFPVLAFIQIAYLAMIPFMISLTLIIACNVHVTIVYAQFAIALCDFLRFHP